jgi:pimeloyl-ACP methyl ester carboxylesterase
MGPLAEAGLVDLIGILRESWPEIPLYLTGGSMGGASALVFATRRPDLLAGVAALCPPADVLGYYSWGIQGREENPTLANITAAIRLHYSIEGRELAEELRARSTLQNASNPHLPVYLSHGAQDPLAPVTWTRLLAAKLRELGYPVEYDELPEGVHDTPVREVDWERVLAFLTQAQ